MPGSLPPSSRLPDDNGYKFAKRWPQKRGHCEIEKQCSKCQWWFDSFDPNADQCRICLKPNTQPLSAQGTGESDNLAPMLPAQQSEVLQTAPGMLPLFNLVNPQLNWITHNYAYHNQTYGQGNDPYYSHGKISNPLGGCMPNQISGQFYSPPPNPPCSVGTMFNNVGAIQSHIEGSIQNNIHNQEHDHTSTIQLNLHYPSQGVKEEFDLSNAKTTVSKSQPLRPLLPRDLPQNVNASNNEGQSNDQNATREPESPDKNKVSEADKQKPSRSNRSHKKKK